MNKQTQALVDSGFQGFQKAHPNTTFPAKNTKLRPLTQQQKNDNRTLARRRVLIEHIIGLLKRVRILAERYRNRRRRFGLRLHLIAAIANPELIL